MTRPASIDLDGPPEDTPQGETAAPVAPKKPKLRTQAPQRSTDSEEHVIACCLLDDGHTLTVARRLLTTDSFQLPSHAAIFRALCELQDSSLPVTLESLVQEHPKAASVAGMPLLMRLTDPNEFPTTAHALYHVERVRGAHVRRQLEQSAKRLLERIAANEDPDDLLRQAANIAPDAPTDTPEPQPITSYAYPADEDPNILLGRDDYLGRGGGMLFVSHAGAGKSSWIMDACMMWGIGRPWMGIRCAKPLRSLIIQAEDSDRYIGKIFTSFAHVNQLTPPQTRTLSENCVIARIKGVTGEAFNRLLSQLTKKHKPDLVVINPIYLYAEGDITKSEYAQPFLVGLDRVNQEEKFAYILIHHTGKPQAKGKDGQRASLDDWESAYMGFGSSYFANWPRCTALLEPVPNEQGRYMVKLGKGGLNAGVTREVDQGAGKRTEAVTRIPIRHSTARMTIDGTERPVYYWEADDAPQPEAPKNPLGAGRKRKYTYEEFENIMPSGKENALGFRPLHRKAREVRDSVGASTFEDILLNAVDMGLLVRDMSNPAQPKYHKP